MATVRQFMESKETHILLIFLTHSILQQTADQRAKTSNGEQVFLNHARVKLLYCTEQRHCIYFSPSLNAGSVSLVIPNVISIPLLPITGGVADTCQTTKQQGV